MTFINHLKDYSFTFTTAAKRDLKKVNSRDAKMIYRKLEFLVSGVQGLDVKKLFEYRLPTIVLELGCIEFCMRCMNVGL